jgi:DNA-directed RNA polymerase subunit alpha
LEPGFGYTLGNSLRRTLLSSRSPALRSPASSIDGVSTSSPPIEGVKEDVTEIILNVKSLVVSIRG